MEWYSSTSCTAIPIGAPPRHMATRNVGRNPLFTTSLASSIESRSRELAEMKSLSMGEAYFKSLRPMKLHLPSESDLEDRTLIVGSAKESSPVEIAVRVLNQGALGFRTVVTRRAEGVQHGFHARRCEFEYRARIGGTAAIGASDAGSSVEIAVRALQQTGDGQAAVRTRGAEGIEDGLHARRRDLEDRTRFFIGASGIGGAVEIAVRAQNQTGSGLERVGTGRTEGI